MSNPSAEILKRAVFELVEECRYRLHDGAPDVSDVDRGVRAYCEALAKMPKEEARRHKPDLEAMMKVVTELSDELKSARDSVGEELQALERIRKANAAYQRTGAIGEKKKGNS